MPGYRNTITGIIARLVPDSEGCLIWTGTKVGNGYGIVTYHGQRHLVHRLLYEHLIGLIPEGQQIDHRCRNRACANVLHLEPVTQRENILRGNGFSAVNARKTHCPQGHPLSGDNLFVDENGYRECRCCHRDQEHRRKLRQYAAEGKLLQLPPAERTHCPQGHPYGGDNLKQMKNGRRRCATCHRESQRERSRRRRAAAKLH